MQALLNRQQVADYLNVHVNPLDKIRRSDPTFPTPVTRERVGPRLSITRRSSYRRQAVSMTGTSSVRIL